MKRITLLSLALLAVFTVRAENPAPAPLPIISPPKVAPAVPKAKAEPNYVAQLSAKLEPARQIVYKKIGDRELHLDIFEPKGLKPGDKRPCFVSIHGGGWTSGAPRSMYRFTEHCTELGMVGVCVQYRLYKAGTDVSVFECVKDARSAVRYVRAHAAELGVDPQKIVVNGASAGGHLAAATAMFNFDEAGEDLSVSCTPNALMLFSPVIDTSKEGYGNAKVGERWEELSPAHRVRSGMPPTILFHGTADTTTPFKGAQLFHDAMLRAGNRSELVKVEEAIHTYMFKDAALYADTLRQMDAFLASLGFVDVTAPVAAKLRLPAVFSDHMVVQAGKPVAIWGWADAGEAVTVSFVGQSKTTKAGADGKWGVRLDAMQASSEPREMIVASGNPQSAIGNLKLNDVLVGEVWLASGQSNMEMAIQGKMHGSVDRADEEIAAAQFPQIRMFVHATPFAIYELPVPPSEPLTDRPGKWTVCSPETVADFSAMGYFFARDLHKQLGAPVGILSAAVGGTPIEAWTSLAAQSDPVLKPMLDDWQKRTANFDPEREQAAYLEKKMAWLKQRADATKKGEPAPKAPLPFKNQRVMTPGALFNGVIAPLVPYTMRGCIWYQGERNANGPFTGLYGAQLKTLIADWRARWGDEFYFAWVQLPGFGKAQALPSEPKGWGVAVRDEMRKTLAVPHTGMAITMDIGDPAQGHGTNKREFAARLSPVVLHDVYAKPVAEWSGPLFRSAQRDGEKMVLTFDHANGLKAAAGELKGFAIAGSDKKFVWAEAKIADGKVVVRSEAVKEPAAVRYGWAANPACNLVNAAGLPASPFRTDDWK
jgi:sialate O-acetylesterase